MRRPLALAILLAGAPLAGVPAVGGAQEAGQPSQTPSGNERLVTPLPAGCVSMPFGSSPNKISFGPISITGGRANRRYLLQSRPDGTPAEGFGQGGSAFGTFDANGATSKPSFTLSTFQPIGPGQEYRITISANGPDTPSDDPADVPTTTSLGSVTTATLGVEVKQLNGKRVPLNAYRPGRKYRVIVSGAPFAKKKLHGFIVDSKRKVLRRFALGTGDFCGHVDAKVIPWPRRLRPGTKVYVSASPKLDLGRSVRTDLFFAERRR